jgi:hypothetical protein
MAKTRVNLLDDDNTKKREQLITVTGSMSNTFHEALDIALDNDAPAEQQAEIAKIVALESAAIDSEIITGLASKYENGYMHRNVDGLTTDIGSDEIVVDVYNADEPNADQLVKGMSVLELVESGEISTEQYVPVFVYPTQAAARTKHLMTGFESLCSKAGVKVCHIVKRD